MRKVNWILSAALLGALLIVGCNPTDENGTGKTGETKIDSADVKKVEGATPSGGSETVKEPVKKDLTPEEVAKAKAKEEALKKESGMTDEKASELAKAQAAKEELSKPPTTDMKVSKANPADRTNVSDPSKQPKPKPTLPADANKGAVAANFSGTWKRFIDPKLRAKYKQVEALQKKRGKKLYPIENMLVVKSDGTFVWDDNALITGRKVTGTWSVKGGVATFTVKMVDGKAPGKDEAKSFEAMVAKSGKMLYRGNSERGRYDKI
ncbi:MAG: hypothetical protein JNK63_01185 [Chthonomonas sp.]|nr:hypothetical protein [Chthonomonas sp.]